MLHVCWIVATKGACGWVGGSGDADSPLHLACLAWPVAPAVSHLEQTVLMLGKGMGLTNIQCDSSAWAQARLLSSGAAWFARIGGSRNRRGAGHTSDKVTADAEDAAYFSVNALGTSSKTNTSPCVAFDGVEGTGRVKILTCASKAASMINLLSPKENYTREGQNDNNVVLGYGESYGDCAG